MRRLATLAFVAALAVYLRRPTVVLQSQVIPRRRWPTACADEASSCSGRRVCDRILADNWLSQADIVGLLSIAKRGMGASASGPTIFDVNSGYVMAPGADLSNIYLKDPESRLFSGRDFELYRRVIRDLKTTVEQAFDRQLYFTAPTFVARLSGENASWSPSSPHDEYWHPHVDKANTAHYEYSGLLYLSDYGVDFQGGLFEFLDERNRSSLQVQPRKGRLLLFSASKENRHRVRRVTEGVRFALSFWFACDARFEFADFLDGKAHLRYRESTKDVDRLSSVAPPQAPSSVGM